VEGAARAAGADSSLRLSLDVAIHALSNIALLFSLLNCSCPSQPCRMARQLLVHTLLLRMRV
jgi:hypothetical protein